MKTVTEVSTEAKAVIEPVENSDLRYQKITDSSGISDEAVLIFTWVVFEGLCQMINIFGIVTNVINIICFIRQHFKDSVNISLLGKKRLSNYI